jgi:hypothetical protein
VGGVSRWSSWDTEWHNSGALLVSLCTIKPRTEGTHDPGFWETEEFPNFSERIGVEREVMLELSDMLIEKGEVNIPGEKHPFPRRSKRSRRYVGAYHSRSRSIA